MTISPSPLALPPATTGAGYVPISRRALDLEDYIDIARRHVAWIIGPMLAGSVVAIVVAFIMPNVYISSAEMQITPPQISESIVQTTVNQQLTQRILQMENEILSRTSISNIIQDPRLDLYKTDRANKPLEDVIELMRRDIKIRIDSISGEGSRRASAFSISYSYPDRIKARDTVQALITRFTDASVTTETKQQNMVNTYVQSEVTEAKAKLDQVNEELTKFRVGNAGKLPEESTLNIAQLASLQQKSGILNDGINRMATERIQLDSALQQLQDRLELYDMFNKESDQASQAPPVTPVVRQQNEQLVSLNRQIEGIEAALAQGRLVFKEKYPDIRDAEARLALMKNERDALLKQQDEDQQKERARMEEAARQPQPVLKKPTDFARAQNLQNLNAAITNQKNLIKSKELDAENAKKELVKTNKDIENFQARLAATSGIQAAYADLLSHQKLATDKYLSFMGKQQLTQQNSDLLQLKAGENLDVIDPPSLPTQPAAPKRLLIVGAGIALSFILGVALAGVQEAKDGSLKNLKDVRAYTNLPVLSSIPLLENTMLVRRQRRIAYLAWSAAVIVGMLAVSAALYYHSTSTV